MGEKIQVWAWIVTEKKAGKARFGEYKFVWGGKSIIAAFYQAWKAKSYSGCIKIEWRGVR